MRAYFKARFLFLLFFILAGHGYARIWLEVKSVNEENRISPNTNTLQLQTYEMYGIEITGHFENESAVSNYISWLRITPNTNEMPGFIQGWEEKKYILKPGEKKDLKNIIYIHPTSAAVDSFKVEAALKHGENPHDFLISRSFKLIVEAEETSYVPPVLIEEPQFSPGLSNTVFWIPGQGSSAQDVYCFDTEDRENLRKSVQGLYKIASSDTSIGVFENLTHSHQYGYFAKAVYENTNSPVVLYSNIQYSVQDNTSPESVLGTQALIDGNGDAIILWDGVSDAVSGIEQYNIYRAVDTGFEQLLGRKPVTDNETGTFTWTDEIDSAYTYYYRVRAVDRVGNEGDGVRTIGISLGGSGYTDLPPGGGSEEDSTSSSTSTLFVKSVIDTIWQKLNGWENAVRFQAVRDSIRYFQSPPSVRMRFFDSGWTDPNLLKTWGWVSPTNPDSIYFVFNYTDTAHVYFDDFGIVHSDTGNAFIDSSFVNNHTYLRRVIRKFYSTTDTTWLGKIIPDCYPPDDIQNLKLQAIIDDPNFQNPVSGYQKWHFELDWNPAKDGVSGLKSYSVYRKINGLDADFVSLVLPDNYLNTHLRDSVLLSDAAVCNPFVQYRVIAADQVGNRRDLNKTAWEVRERTLNAPKMVISQEAGIKTFPLDPTHADTVFTDSDQIAVQLFNFDHSDLKQYIVAVNDKEQVIQNQSQNKLLIPLSNAEISTIKVRVLYQGQRSSVWSNSRVVIRALKKAPEQFVSANDSSKWYGHIYLQWKRSSLDSKSYEIWRRCIDEPWKLIGTAITSENDIGWVDSYGLDELTALPGDTLTTYQSYSYKVRMINIFDMKSEFSEIDSSYCNHPPVIADDEINAVGGSMMITIFWERIERAVPSDSWNTRIRIYRNNMDDSPFHSANVIDDTTYTYGPVDPGYNYIFQVMEKPNEFNGGSNSGDKISSWSQPYTVTLDTLSMTALSQPMGSVYIDWNDPVRIANYKIDTFKLCRNDVCWLFPKEQTSFMDLSQDLNHGEIYQYMLYGLDSLNQVVASNNKTATSDTGSVFIPEIAPFPTPYFNNDSVNVSWQWRNPDGSVNSMSSRGAVRCLIQASVSRTFPSLPDQTEERMIDLIPLATSANVCKPALASEANDTIYFRITAWDGWNHPIETIWSTHYFPTEKAIFDPIKPLPVKDLCIDSVKSSYKKSDAAVTYMRWSGAGVEVPDSDHRNVWNRLLGNVAYYRVERIGLQDVYPVPVAEIPVDSDIQCYHYASTADNRNYQWQIVSVDSAGNDTDSNLIQSVVSPYIPTPEPPVPTQFRACTIRPVSSESLTFEYFVEIAMDSAHFRLAYEIDTTRQEFMNHLLCRSEDWIEGPDFICQTGWGAVELDTTWFRVKARVKNESGVESGWSNLIYYTGEDDLEKGNDPYSNSGQIPKTFDVHQNYPNPFNATTRINYQIPEDGLVQVRIFNLLGSVVNTLVEENKPAGYHTIFWYGDDQNRHPVASGIYLVRVSMKTKQQQVFQKQFKMMYIK